MTGRIGLLFAVICISVNTYIRLTDVTEAPLEYQDNLEAVAELFRVRTVECLIHADITKTQDLLLETLILHSHVEYTSENEGSKESMLLFSMIARLAVTQGYHRDPEQHSNLTVFQAEMRRRVWDVMNQYELCFSAQYGIPKIIRYAEVDTKPVSNLHEHELFEEMSVLPPSKPISEKTEIGYQIVICEVMRGYGRVIEFLHLVAPQPYEAVMKLDESLMKMREEVPAHLHLKSLQEMHGDASHVILERYVIQQFYHKSICVLHRKYWNVASLEPGGLYSRFTCVASAISLLDLQATMHEASVPGGLLEKIKWYHFSIANHDFLLAAMILSLDLVCEQKSVDEEAAKTTYLSWATPSEKILTLKRSLAVWTDVAEECSDAKRAIHIFNAVLKELRSKPEYSQFFSPQPDPLPSLTAVQKDPAAGSAQPENAGQWNTDPFFQKQFSISVPGTGIPGNEDTVAASENFNGNSLALDGGLWEAFGTDMDLPTDFDWEAWDQFINGNVAQPPISLD
ncbi:fungal specific transcription factor domain-containing protein [Phlyctema vagabunda]|uniref:Fungal specific transcription factor domain-containing protein n=1 Tax=Phlyctema vagabunda TaxID=108571 RepID=A0ABR4PH22_9HELO